MDIYCDYEGVAKIPLRLFGATGSPSNIAYRGYGSFPLYIPRNYPTSERDVYYFNNVGRVECTQISTMQGSWIYPIGPQGFSLNYLHYPCQAIYDSRIDARLPQVFGLLEVFDMDATSGRIPNLMVAGVTQSNGWMVWEKPNNFPTLDVSASIGTQIWWTGSGADPVACKGVASILATAEQGSESPFSSLLMRNSMFVLYYPETNQYSFFPISFPNYSYRLLSETPNSDILPGGAALTDLVFDDSSRTTSDYYQMGSVQMTGRNNILRGQSITVPRRLDGVILIPTTDISKSNLVTIFNPSEEQLQDLASVLWMRINSFSSLFNNVKKLVSDPMDLLVSLTSVPVRPDTGDTVGLKFGGISFGNAVSMPVVTSQYVEIPMGSVTIPLSWGTYLDYSPYTKIMCWLPYIGGVQLDADWIAGKTVSLKYTIDVVSGECAAELSADGYVMYHYSGNCAIQIPITASNHGRQIAGLAAVTAAALPPLMSLGAAGAAAASAGRLAAKSVSAKRTERLYESELLNFKQQSMVLGAAGVGSVMAGKTQVAVSGSVGPNAGAMMDQHPYIILTYPRLDLADNYKHYVGYPCNKTLRVGDCSGFTIYESIDVKNIPCTLSERTAIEKILTSGFYA